MNSEILKFKSGGIISEWCISLRAARDDVVSKRMMNDRLEE